MLGMLAARRRGRALDAAVSATAVSLLAMPEFVVGTILSIVFAVELGWFPVSSAVPDDAVSFFHELTLPAAVLALVLFGSLARVARAATLAALEADYTRTATLKGLPARIVLLRHVLPNVLPPTIAAIGAQVGYLVGGIVVVETLFAYPGLGKLILDSAQAHDLASLEACVLATAIVVMAANLAADLAASALNPRLRRAAA
jgi:peptide/nickel transport system permease protein